MKNAIEVLCGHSAQNLPDSLSERKRVLRAMEKLLRAEKTLITLTADNAQHTVRVGIGGSTGNFRGALKRRAWVLRIHRPADWPETLVPTQARQNEKTIGGFHRLARNETAMPFGDKLGAPDADVFELELATAPVKTERQVEVTFAPKR